MAGLKSSLQGATSLSSLRGLLALAAAPGQGGGVIAPRLAAMGLAFPTAVASFADQEACAKTFWTADGVQFKVHTINVSGSTQPIALQPLPAVASALGSGDGRYAAVGGAPANPTNFASASLWHPSLITIENDQMVFTYNGAYINASFGATAIGGAGVLNAYLEYPAGVFTPILFNGIKEFSPGSTSVVSRQWQSDALNVPAALKNTVPGGVAINGDSIPYGQGDVTGVGARQSSGWAARRCAALGLPYVKFCKPGMTADAMAKIINGTFAGTFLIPFLEKMRAVCGEIDVAYYRNDLITGRTAAQLVGDLQSIAAYMGKPTYAATATPAASSSNVFVDTAGQTPDATGNWSQDTAFSDVVRAGIAGLAGYIDISDAASSSRNSRVFVTAGTLGGVPTADNVHPSTLLHARISANAAKVG